MVGQYIVTCRHCRANFYVPQSFPPAVVLDPEVTEEKAKGRVIDGLRHKEIAKGFLKKSFFEKATLYFIPIFEVRGIKTGWTPPAPDSLSEFNFQSFDYLEKANDIHALKLGFLDYALVEESLLQARQVPFDPVLMRQKGVILPADKVPDVMKREQAQSNMDVVERYHRIIYFPVWEIAYTYRGILFRSYVSAVAGEILKLHGLRSHQTKLLLAIGGLFSLGALLPRVLKMIFIMNQTPAVGFSLFFFVIGFPILLFITFLLLPYFWRLFAFREEVVITGQMVDRFSINYTENKWIRWSRGVGEKVTRFFEGPRENPVSVQEPPRR